jgi:type VI secretion system protein ImpK
MTLIVTEDELTERKETPAVAKILRADNLSLLYQGIITAAVRVRSGDRPIVDICSFRRNMLDMLTEVEREAYRLKYEKQLVADATFAVIVYVDESIFSSSDAQRNQWSALQAELFGKAMGGEDFFKKLEELRKQPNSPRLADAIEVYLLCLLLGYQGRYGKVAPGELQRVADDLQARIDLIRGHNDRFSPEVSFADTEKSLIVNENRAVVWLRWSLFVLLVLMPVLWIVLKIHLGSEVDEVTRELALKQALP